MYGSQASPKAEQRAETRRGRSRGSRLLELRNPSKAVAKASALIGGGLAPQCDTAKCSPGPFVRFSAFMRVRGLAEYQLARDRHHSQKFGTALRPFVFENAHAWRQKRQGPGVGVSAASPAVWR